MLKNTRLFESKQTLQRKTPEQIALQDAETIMPQFQKDPQVPAIGRQSAQAPIHVIQVDEEGKRPFFLLHGIWTGEVPFYCYALARSLGRKQPFYALDPFNLNGPYKPVTIEEMAAMHVKTLQSIQPEGPYQLGGFCNGSLIVYEMARQLHEQGQKVDFLLLIAPSTIARVRRISVGIMHRLCTIVHIKPLHQLILFLRLRQAALHMYRKLRPSNNSALQDFPKLLAIEPLLDKMFPPAEALLHDYVGVFTWIASIYQKRFIPEHIDCIWAADELEGRETWATIEQGKPSPIIPGHHMEFATERTDLLMEEVKICWQRFQADTNTQAACIPS